MKSERRGTIHQFSTKNVQEKDVTLKKRHVRERRVSDHPSPACGPDGPE